ncbi:xanthine dehydrogenase family protein molybdopterin-binding subunit [Porticoccaceae bacterium LTM1]|nr:xanthine dehydrogenase family protein molybdopterin-binding subunit [Porticoccaceae bacterium LTM1]
MSEVMQTISRRSFLKLSSTAGAGLALGVHLSLSGCSENKEPSKVTPEGTEFSANAFVRIDPDNTVHLVMKHFEMGQGTFTGLATLIAEELDASWDQVVCESAPADGTRYNNLSWGPVQGTGGSSAMNNAFMQMRRAGAAARKMMVDAAAGHWGVPAEEIAVTNGVVSHTGSGNKATFGELTGLAALMPVPGDDSLTLKQPEDFKLIGTKLPRKDKGKTDGTAKFTQDVQLPGMLTAVVAHPPKFGATVKSVDGSQARSMAGVTDVVTISSGVAVVASDYWTAKSARDALKIDWDESNAFTQSSDEIMASYRAMADKNGEVGRSDGDAKKALKQAEEVIESSYEFPYLAHAAMEPMNCVAQVTDEGCELWNADQIPTLDQGGIAVMLGIQPDKVKINTLYAGGSFGRRANPKSDYVLEAVEIARSQKGTPVKMVWSREDDTRAGYFRPMYFHKIRGALDDKGMPLAWYQTVVGQPVLKGTPFHQGGIDQTSVEGASTLPYQMPNLQVELHTVTLPVTVQWWRSVGHTHTAYSTETFIDELAAKAGRDPVEYRSELLQNHPRHLGVLKLAAEKADWGKPLPKGWGRGIAVHESFKSFVAQVAEVSVDDSGNYRVERVVCAVDCGVAINPDVIAAQMEGGIGYGLSPVMVSEITLDKGQVAQSNFHDYQVLRFNQMPKVEVHIVPSTEPPTGVGEPGTPPIAPAVANALSAVTGKRYYKLPITKA